MACCTYLAALIDRANALEDHATMLSIAADVFSAPDESAAMDAALLGITERFSLKQGFVLIEAEQGWRLSESHYGKQDEVADVHMLPNAPDSLGNVSEIEVVNAQRDTVIGGISIGLGWGEIRVPILRDNRRLGLIILHTAQTSHFMQNWAASRDLLKLLATQLAIALSEKRFMAQASSLRAQTTRIADLASAAAMSVAVGHEIRNALGTLRVSLETSRIEQELAGGDVPPNRLRVLSTALGAERASALGEVDRLTELTRIVREVATSPSVEQGSQKRRRPQVPCFLNEVVDPLARMLRDQAREAKLKLAVSLDRRLNKPTLRHDSLLAGWAIMANKASIAQILTNLVINAIDASPSGARIDVATRLDQDDTGGSAVLTVRDYGIGMTEKKRRAAFDMFWTDKPNGMGLGLFVVNSLVVAQGARLSLSSELGRGTTFEISWPTVR